MIRELVPVGFKNYINLMINKRRFRGRIILSPAINKSVSLGIPCGIHSNVVLESGVKIGDYSYVNSGTRVGKNVTIGKYCSIAYNCLIGMGDHPVDFVSTSPFTFGENNVFNKEIAWDDYNRKVVIGNDVWIGSNAIIMQGIKIGNGAIIAAGAVVTKDVQPYSVVGGIPAKEIKKRFDKDRISYLQRLEWWNLSESELQDYKNIFSARSKWAEQINIQEL